MLRGLFSFKSPCVENNVFVYLRNKARFNFDSLIVNEITTGKALIYYGDSLIYFKDLIWYESRPKFSPILLTQNDYLGDVIISRFDLDISSPNELNLRIIDYFKKNYHISNLEFAIGIRNSHILNSHGTPKLFDQREFQKNQPCKITVKSNFSYTIIIPTKFQENSNFEISKLLDTIYCNSIHDDYEIILVFHESDAHKLDKLKSNQHVNYKALTYKGDFNYSKVMNYAARNSTHDVLVFLNDDILLGKEFNFTKFLNHLLMHNVAIVGSKLLYIDGTIQDAGLEFRNGRPMNFLKGSDVEFLNQAHSNCREVSGVSGALFAMRKDIFWEIGALDENFPYDYNDVDLMLKSLKRGYSNILCVEFEVYHSESMTRSDSSLNRIENDLINLVKIHGNLPIRDPFLYTPADRS
jgi:hypothetical protein